MKKSNIFSFYIVLTIALLYSSCLSSQQATGYKVIEANQEKKYKLIKTRVFKGDAVILEDTTNVFNRFMSKDVVRQYIFSIDDVLEYERLLEKSFILNNEISYSSAPNSEELVKYFKHFRRQYSGYINDLGDTLLVVCFVDFTRKKKAKEFFFNWKYQQIYLGSGLYIDKIPPGGIYCYSYNKRTKQINRYK